MKPNKFIQSLKPYIPIAHKVWEIQKEQNVLKLDWNESTISLPKHIIFALQEAIANDRLYWYPNTSNSELLELLSGYVGLNKTCMEFFASSDCAHEFILQVFAIVGEKVCIVSPTYDNFRSRADGIGLSTFLYRTDENNMIDFIKLDYYLALQNPKICYICNPNNPTGVLHDVAMLEQLILKHQSVLFVIDEAYYEFCNVSMSYLLPHTTNLIITRTFSKAFGLASFRIGYCLSSPQNISALNLLRNAKNIPHLSQVAATAALKDRSYMENYTKEVVLARTWFIKELESISVFKIYNSSGNFVFMRYKDIAALKIFLESKNIFIRDYTHIVENHCRISIGTMAQMQYVLNAIKEFCNKN